MSDCAEKAEPSTAKVLAEVERRTAEKERSSVTDLSEGQRRIVVFLDRIIFWLSKHWIVILNTLALLYVGLPVLAPILMHLGASGVGNAIYRLYEPLCHQLPRRSFFLFGEQLTYSYEELVARVGVDVLPSPWTRSFLGNDVVGYKIGICQRDVAIYGSIFLAGIVYGLLKDRVKIKPLPIWAYFLMCVPMALDGGIQLLSAFLGTLWPNSPFPSYESTPMSRVLTGTLFGVATIWLAYPYLQEASEEFREKLQKRFGWE